MPLDAGRIGHLQSPGGRFGSNTIKRGSLAETFDWQMFICWRQASRSPHLGTAMPCNASCESVKGKMVESASSSSAAYCTGSLGILAPLVRLQRQHNV